MKKIILYMLLFFPLVVQATQVHTITAQTTHMPPETLKQLFHLRQGNLFTEKSYEQAKEDLQQLPIFRKLEFLEHEHKDGIDIHIKADDRSYVFPLFLGLSGNKHAVGFSVGANNVFHQGEDMSFFIGGGRDGFDTHGSFSQGKHSISSGYTHLNFNQRFYEGGWMSQPGIFSTTDDKNKHNEVLLADIHGTQDDFFLTYQYQLSHLWKLSVTPEYEYYKYQDNALDTGNHSHLSMGVQYTDNISAGMNIRGMDGIEHLRKDDMLRDLPYVRRGKTADITYTTGGGWTGSDYHIDKLALSGAYLWEFKTRHILAVFAKAQRAFSAPFSNQIESSDLLFGMGIYDREQRGKGGVSAGVGLTYFLLRNKTGLLSISPFYEQAYITSGGNSYEPHTGIGATVSFRWWPIPLPISANFTHNLNDGNHHLGCKVGGKF